MPETVVREAADATVAELCWAYSRRVPRSARTNAHEFRAGDARWQLRLEKKREPLDVVAKRRTFVTRVRRQDPTEASPQTRSATAIDTITRRFEAKLHWES
jgi:hypothetical protein